MKTMKYRELLSQTEKQLEAAQLEATVKTAELQLEQDLVSTQLALSQAEVKLKQTELQVPFSSQNILNAEDEVNGYTLGLERLKKLKARLF